MARTLPGRTFAAEAEEPFQPMESACTLYRRKEAETDPFMTLSGDGSILKILPLEQRLARATELVLALHSLLSTAYRFDKSSALCPIFA